MSLNKDIAVIGISCLYANAKNEQELWKIISSGRTSLYKANNKELLDFGVSPDKYNDINYVPVGPIFPKLDFFDYESWGISKNEALYLNPQIKKFLEHSKYLLDKTGYTNKNKNIRIGVFSGMSDNGFLNHKKNDDSESWIKHISTSKDFLSTKISYHLNLYGPSININTACSTSLSCLSEACNNLILGFCDIALAGAVSIPLSEDFGYMYREGFIYSKNGLCMPFDDRSNGTVPSGGLGIALLKPLNNAIKDNDNIVSIIKGYNINNDGKRKIGYHSPSIWGQSECIYEAQRMANISAETIGYIEAHGTGTKIGDAIEIEGLKNAFEKNSSTENYNCYLGSLKANIGHSDSASGMAGFIKACLMLKNKTIPPQVNYVKSSNISKMNKFIINEKKIYWKEKPFPRRVGVSSFGIGGTNGHIILEEYKKK